MKKQGLGRKSLEEQSSDVIRSYLVDPNNSELPEYLHQQLKRVLQAAKLLDDYPNDTHIINLMLAKYNVSRTQIRKDIDLAKELFKSQHRFDWDFWFAWQIKDQIELIRKAKLQGNLKEWNNAKKTLLAMIGERPASIEDPRRMEKNVFYIQVNNQGQMINIYYGSYTHLRAHETVLELVCRLLLKKKKPICTSQQSE